MDKEDAIKYVTYVRNTGLVIDALLVMIIGRFALAYGVSFITNCILAFSKILLISVILNGLSFGVYKFKSRVCAIALLAGTITLLIALVVSAPDVKFPFIIFVILIYIYYKGVRAVFSFHNNKLVN